MDRRGIPALTDCQDAVRSLDDARDDVSVAIERGLVRNAAETPTAVGRHPDHRVPGPVWERGAADRNYGVRGHVDRAQLFAFPRFAEAKPDGARRLRAAQVPDLADRMDRLVRPHVMPMDDGQEVGAGPRDGQGKRV